MAMFSSMALEKTLSPGRSFWWDLTELMVDSGWRVCTTLNEIYIIRDSGANFILFAVFWGSGMMFGTPFPGGWLKVDLISLQKMKISRSV